ncbi:MAG: hypothetical protein IVW54_16740 [Candidatus Binataceae bacterium]|nr:hypothetical protein [Candidatus Binataceae bacterium]
MAGFHIPVTLPPELQEIVDQSGERFQKILRKELGAFATMVNIPGWVEQYRDEVAQSVLKAYQLGEAKVPNGQG